MTDKPNKERAVVSMAVMGMQASGRLDEETSERLLQIFDAGYEALEQQVEMLQTERDRAVLGLALAFNLEPQLKIHRDLAALASQEEA